MKQYHDWNISDVENMIPFERDIYVNMIIAYMQELKEKE